MCAFHVSQLTPIDCTLRRLSSAKPDALARAAPRCADDRPLKRKALGCHHELPSPNLPVTRASSASSGSVVVLVPVGRCGVLLNRDQDRTPLVGVSRWSRCSGWDLRPGLVPGLVPVSRSSGFGLSAAKLRRLWCGVLGRLGVVRRSPRDEDAEAGLLRAGVPLTSPLMSLAVAPGWC